MIIDFEKEELYPDEHLKLIGELSNLAAPGKKKGFTMRIDFFEASKLYLSLPDFVLLKMLGLKEVTRGYSGEYFWPDYKLLSEAMMYSDRHIRTLTKEFCKTKWLERHPLNPKLIKKTDYYYKKFRAV